MSRRGRASTRKAAAPAAASKAANTAAADMSRHVAPAPLRHDKGRQAGLFVVASILCFSAVWLQLRGARAVNAEAPPMAPALIASVSPRFAPDFWYLPAEDLLGFVAIPAGSFVMGSDPARDRQAYENERWSLSENQGRVEQPLFYMGRYEVTVAQFNAFIAATGFAVNDDVLRGAGDLPVANVAWTDALAYARWLESQLLASPETPLRLLELLRDGWRVTLPSEAEWEKAARGSDGRVYPWGDEIGSGRSNFGASGTVPVGSIACADCAFQLADMSGNVWELTRSPHQPYPYQVAEGRTDPRSSALYVMRGGSFAEGPNNARAAVRGGIDPGARRPFIGFRLVITGALRR